MLNALEEAIAQGAGPFRWSCLAKIKPILVVSCAKL